MWRMWELRRDVRARGKEEGGGEKAGVGDSRVYFVLLKDSVLQVCYLGLQPRPPGGYPRPRPAVPRECPLFPATRETHTLLYSDMQVGLKD